MLLTRDDCKGRRSSISAVVEMGVDIISFDMRNLKRKTHEFPAHLITARELAKAPLSTMCNANATLLKMEQEVSINIHPIK
jgi:hypothetical protein